MEADNSKRKLKLKKLKTFAVKKISGSDFKTM
jgi:hypothetical protein